MTLQNCYCACDHFWTLGTTGLNVSVYYCKHPYRLSSDESATSDMVISIFKSLVDFLHTSYKGIRYDIPGNGGIKCYEFLSLKHRFIDTSIYTFLIVVLTVPSLLKNLTVPTVTDICRACTKRTSQEIVGFRKVLLIFLTMVFGIEIGYKMSQDNWLYLLNPCHVITVMQVS